MDLACALKGGGASDEMQGHVDAGADACVRDDLPVVDPSLTRAWLGRGVEGRDAVERVVVGRERSLVQQPRGGKDASDRANTRDDGTSLRSLLQPAAVALVSQTLERTAATGLDDDVGPGEC